MKNQETNIEKLANRILDMELTAHENRTKLKERFDAELWRTHEKQTAELEDLKNRLQREKRLKQQSKERFLRNSFGTSDDFERLWESKLRDEAIMEESQGLKSMRRHSMYNEF